VIFVDTFAIPPSGFVAVREYGSSPPPAASLGLGENRALFVIEVCGRLRDGPGRSAVVFVETGAMARRPSEAYFTYAAASRRRQRAGIGENHRAP